MDMPYYAFDFQIKPPPLERFCHDGDDVGNVERLGNEISGPEADGFLSMVKRPIAGDDDDFRVRLKFFYLFQGVDA